MKRYLKVAFNFLSSLFINSKARGFAMKSQSAIVNE